MAKVGSHFNFDILCADSYVRINEIFARRKELDENYELLSQENNVKKENNAAMELLKVGIFDTK